MPLPFPYRADHVGSFLRPAELLEARRSGVPTEQLHVFEDKHILRVLEKQKELGFEVITDGELRRSNFMSDFTDAVEGFDLGDAVPRHWDDSARQASNQTAAVSLGESQSSLNIPAPPANAYLCRARYLNAPL
jgi:methionine synthase II (cobalamin-independent)